MTTEVIRGYASALLRIAEAEGDLERVNDELFHFGKTLEQHHELRTALSDIAVPDEQKRAVIADLLGDRAADATRHIIDFVVAQGRARDLGDIVASLADQTADLTQKVLAEVRSAVPLDEEQRQRLAVSLSRATGRTVDVKVIVDPKVIGGIYARVGDQVIDGTVRKRLQDLRETIRG